MNLPFTPAQFFDVFAAYNTAVWPAQIPLKLAALVVLWWIYRGNPASGRWISAVLAALWAWMAVVYHFAFFTAINKAAWLFGAVFLVGALAFLWRGTILHRLQFGIRGDARGWAAYALIVFALAVYPALGQAFGTEYPAAPTFGLPCPTTIFTIGVLLLAKSDARAVLVVPILWAAVGSTAAFALGVYQDLGLLVAGLVGLLGMRHKRTTSAFSIPTTPSG
jgi:hypothetical protein